MHSHLPDPFVRSVSLLTQLLALKIAKEIKKKKKERTNNKHKG
jgi:hypothetical protein